MDKNVDKIENMLRVMFASLQKVDNNNIKERAKEIIKCNISMIKKSENNTDKIELLNEALERIDEEFTKFILEKESKENLQERLKNLQALIDEDEERF